MALFKRYQPPQPAPTRPPNEDGLLNWILREAHPFLIQTQRWLSRCVSYMGKVGVDDTDYPGVAEDKLVATTGVTITKTGPAGDRQLVFGANATEITNIVNTTTIVNAPTTGATLFPCDIPDPLLRGDAVGLLPHGSGVGFGDGFTWFVIPGQSRWQAGMAGPLVPYGGTLQAQDGDLIFAWSSVPYGAYEPQSYGLYRVVDCGFHWVPTPGHPETLMGQSTKAVIERASSANTPAGLCHGMTVHIVGRDAVEHNGDYFTLTTADPIVVDTTALTFTYSPTYTSGAVTNLLTPAQTAVADSLMWSSGVACSNGGYVANDVAFFVDGQFVTKAGTPGAATIPAGPWTVYAKLRVTSPDLVTPPRVDFKFRVKHVDNSTDADFLTCSSPPLTSSVDAIYSFQGNLAAPATIVPTDRIEMRMFGHATGTTVQSIVLTWQNVTRDTRVVTTLALGGFGSGVHDDLTGRENPNAHAFVCSVTEAGGLLPAITANTVVVIPSASGATINGISTTGLTTGVKLNLVFKFPVTLANQASVGAGYAPFLAFSMGGSLQSPEIDQNNGRVEVQYFASELSASPCFVINAGPLS